MRCSQKTTFPLHYFRLVPKIDALSQTRLPSFVKTFEKAFEFLILITSYSRRIKPNLLTTNRTLLQTCHHQLFSVQITGRNLKTLQLPDFCFYFEFYLKIKLGKTNITITATKLRFQSSVPTKM